MHSAEGSCDHLVWVQKWEIGSFHVKAYAFDKEHSWKACCTQAHKGKIGLHPLVNQDLTSSNIKLEHWPTQTGNALNAGSATERHQPPPQTSQPPFNSPGCGQMW